MNGTDTLQNKKYGGYLPIELNFGREYHTSDDAQSVFSFNSGRAAICYGAALLQARRVFIPHYICPDLRQLLEAQGLTVEQYYIDADWMPSDLPCPGAEDAVLLVNYFGLTHARIRQRIHEFKHVIVDNSQAFFAPPILREGVMNIYSCPKFIGVPDGGYLVTKKRQDETVALDMDHSSGEMDFCIKSLEYGTQGTYQQKKDNNQRLTRELRQMSYMTHRILMNADYRSIRERRMANLRVLHAQLRTVNRLQLDDIDFVPYYYPLYHTEPVQEKLVGKGVYVPVLWKELLSAQYEGTREQDLSEHLIFLPLDQRYDAADMQEISRRVKVCLL